MPRNGVRYMTENPLEGPKRSRKGANERHGGEKRFGTKRGSSLGLSRGNPRRERASSPSLRPAFILLPCESRSRSLTRRGDPAAIFRDAEFSRIVGRAVAIYSDSDTLTLATRRPRALFRSPTVSASTRRRLLRRSTAAARNRVIGMTYFARAYSPRVARHSRCSLAADCIFKHSPEQRLET